MVEIAMFIIAALVVWHVGLGLLYSLGLLIGKVIDGCARARQWMTGA